MAFNAGPGVGMPVCRKRIDKLLALLEQQPCARVFQKREHFFHAQSS